MFEIVFCSCNFLSLSLAPSFGLHSKTSAPSQAEVSQNRAVCRAADIFKYWLLYFDFVGSAEKIFLLPILGGEGAQQCDVLSEQSQLS